MATPKQEYDRICAQVADTSRFFRVALHVHSPESHDFGRTGDKALNDRARLKERVKKSDVRSLFCLVQDTGSEKGFFVSVLGLQKGAKLVAEAKNISSIII